MNLQLFCQNFLSAMTPPHSISLWILCFVCGIYSTISFQVPWAAKLTVTAPSTSRLFSTSADEDWRAFRARLVMMMNDTASNAKFKENVHTFIPAASSWTYDAGLLLEKGSIVLSRMEKLACPDLDQPFFCKSVVLIVEHDEDTMTQGIILNRPSDLRLDDQGNVLFGEEPDESIMLEEFVDPKIRYPHRWRMFFGGEIANLEESNIESDSVEEPTIVCLHNLTTPKAQEVSDKIIPGVYMTSHSAARALVTSGEATADSFYLFYGFCGWDPNQLQAEVQTGSWYVASTDPKTLWKDLAVMRDDSYDTRFAGVEMWENLLGKLGKSHEIQQDDQAMDDFPDLMLKEWVTQTLFAPAQDTGNAGVDDYSIYRAISAASRPPVQPGSLLRASSQVESPYLLQEQFLHKSTILVLQENKDASMGVILNLPTSDVFSLQINNDTIANFVVRYGGPSSYTEANNDIAKSGFGTVEATDDDDEPMIWLHCAAGLKFLRTGKPFLAGDENGVWTCTTDQVKRAIDFGFAAVDDFMLVKGLCLWEKEAGSGGIQGQIMEGNLEMVPPENIDGAWTPLRRQKQLDDASLEENVNLAKEAWKRGLVEGTTIQGDTPTARLVFGSAVNVTDLADRALEAWMRIHLMEDASDTPRL